MAADVAARRSSRDCAAGRPAGVRRATTDALSSRTSRVEVRQDDFRVTRFRQRRPTTTVFVVDASGSTALHRLGEAKGAVELLLADCYVRRDRVALIAFRGRGAELLLPPTRSLVRAKRCLASLPGGGGTPLAAGIDAAAALADAESAAVRLREAGVDAVVVDTSPRPGPLAQRLAEVMQARYLPLPRADAVAVSRAVASGVAEGRRAGAA